MRRTKAEIEQIKAQSFLLLQQGVPVSEIARKYNMVNANLYNWFGDYIKQRSEDNEKEKANLKSKVVELYLSGKASSEVAKCLNINQEKVLKILRKDNITRKPEDFRNSQEYVAEVCKSKGYEYLGGYVTRDSLIKVKCVKCGKVYTKQWCAINQAKCVCDCVRAEQTRVNQELKETKRIELEKRKADKELKQEQKLLKDLFIIKSRIKECKQCGNKFISFNGNVYCSSGCKKKTLNKAGDNRLKGHIIDKDITLPKLIKRDKGICRLCGKPIDLLDKKIVNGTVICGNNYPSIDHIYPLALGGLHSWDNIQLAHRLCNSIKRDTAPCVAEVMET